MKITGFGGTAVMMPAAAVIVAWLLAGRAWRMVLWWCLLFSFGIGIVVATKLAFIGWGVGVRSLDFTGISGHSMRATAVIPVMLYLLLLKARPVARASGVVLGLAVGVIIGISRVVLHAHSVSESVAGCLLGGIVSLGFIWVSAALPKPRLNRWQIAFGLLVLFATSYIEPAPTRLWMRDVALYLSGHDKPYIRAVWKLLPSN